MVYRSRLVTGPMLHKLTAILPQISQIVSLVTEVLNIKAVVYNYSLKSLPKGGGGGGGGDGRQMISFGWVIIKATVTCL